MIGGTLVAEAESVWRGFKPLVWAVIRYRGCFGGDPGDQASHLHCLGAPRKRRFNWRQFMQRMTSRTSLFVLLLLAASSSQAFSQQGSSPQERACFRDVQRHCKDAVPNQDRVLECLRAHGGQLRPSCRKVLTDNHQL